MGATSGYCRGVDWLESRLGCWFGAGLVLVWSQFGAGLVCLASSGAQEQRQEQRVRLSRAGTCRVRGG